MPHFMVLAADADPVLLQAVLELPNYASGITDEARVLVTNQLRKRSQPSNCSTLPLATPSTWWRAAREFPSDGVLTDFVATSIGGTGVLDADVDRTFADLAIAA